MKEISGYKSLEELINKELPDDVSIIITRNDDLNLWECRVLGTSIVIQNVSLKKAIYYMIKEYSKIQIGELVANQ